MKRVIRDEAYEELAAYTLSRGDAGLMHQHVVDAYAVQTATEHTKPIRVAQALVGLYLHVEHGLTGRRIQRTHQILADRNPAWPTFVLPANRGSLTARDVVAADPGDDRDAAIERWATATWTACRALGDEIEVFLSANGITPPR